MKALSFPHDILFHEKDEAIRISVVPPASGLDQDEVLTKVPSLVYLLYPQMASRDSREAGSGVVDGKYLPPVD